MEIAVDTVLPRQLLQPSLENLNETSNPAALHSDSRFRSRRMLGGWHRFAKIQLSEKQDYPTSLLSVLGRNANLRALCHANIPHPTQKNMSL